MKRCESILLQPVSTKRASEAIFEQIRKLITSGELKPGDRLPSERGMMEMLKRSRPTIREALRLLESAGLISIVPGSGGAIIKAPSKHYVKFALENLIALNDINNSELLEYRKLNEIAAAAWAAERRTQADLDALSEYLVVGEIPTEEFIQYDFGFRQCLICASHNRLTQVVDEVLDSLVYDLLQSRFLAESEGMRQQIIKDVNASHEAIFKAVERQDVELSRVLMRNHIEIFAHRVDEVIPDSDE